MAIGGVSLWCPLQATAEQPVLFYWADLVGSDAPWSRFSSLLLLLAQTSCEVTAPSETRPTEGTIQYSVELSPMAAPSFEPGRPSPLAIELRRVLERGLKECRAVDCESLCIVAGEKVWAVRVDVHVLDHCGNLVMGADDVPSVPILHGSQ